MSNDLIHTPIFDICNLRCGYQSGMPLISIPRMRIVSGQVVGICGANGSGKSTLMKALLGLTPYVEGSIHVNGHELPRVRPETIAKSIRVGYLPQHSRAFANLSVWENISIACQGENKRRQVENLLARTEYEALRDISTAPARSLSGGEALMLGLACLEAFDPEILFLDEPTAGADQALRDFCVKLIFRWSKEGRGVMLVEQDHAALLTVADACYALVPVPVSNDNVIWQPPNAVLPIPNEQYGQIRSEKAADKLMDIVKQLSESGMRIL